MKGASLPFLSKSRGNFSFETDLYQAGYKTVAGTDEAGRGSLAGPVVAACVVLPQDCDHSLFEDSKKLTSKKRDQLLQVLKESDALIGIGFVSERQIEKLNILQASLLAMKIAVQKIEKHHSHPDFVLVDGKFEIPHDVAQLALTKGETKSASIAAASIVAKTTRDSYMLKMHEKFPQYGLNSHSGYPTKKHREAIKKFGPCPLHRVTFKGVKEYVSFSKKAGC